MLFFALISYTPKDVPSWIWFSHISPSNHPAQNFIGPVGAIVAGICYQLIGVFASLLVAAVLLGFGAAKLFHSRLRVVPRPIVGHQPLVRVEGARGYSRVRWPDRLSLGRRTSRPASRRSRPRRLADSRDGSLSHDVDFGYRTAPYSSCSRDGRRHAESRDKAARMAIAPEASQVGSQGKTGDQ